MASLEASNSPVAGLSSNPTYAASDHLLICNGVINPTIWERTGNGKDKLSTLTLTVNTREIDVFKITTEDIKYLESITEVAYYSHKNEKTTDVTVQNSKYTKTFDLNLDFRGLMKEMAIEKALIKPYKLNLYTEGSFFAAHRDTNQHGLMGTLILILPTAYTGGQICFGDFNVEATMPKDKLRFVYFDLGLEHSIKKVESGCRITLVYNVLDPTSPASLIQSTICFNKVPKPIYRNLLREAIEFCEGKENILFGQHKYRNDVFYELLEDLEETGLTVLKVMVRKNDHSYSPTKPNDISKITEVYEIENEDDDDMENDDKVDLECLADNTYPVEHVLFPLASELKEHSIQQWKTTGYEGNSPERTEYKIECYTAFLINPNDQPIKKQKRW